MSFKEKILALHNRYLQNISPRRFAGHLAVLIASTVLIRLLLALPALNAPETLLRPDSMGYWQPALALADGEGFVTAPGSTVPATDRLPGYPVFLALSIIIGGQHYLAAALAGIIISAAGIIPIVLAVRSFSGDKPALFAGWLYALNITSIALAPQILADNLLGVVAAWQLWAATAFLQKKNPLYLAVLTLFTVAGFYVKPVNLPVIAAGLPLIVLAGSRSVREFLTGIVIVLFLAGALTMPMLVRNQKLFGGVEGASTNLYFHNGSAIIAHATGESSESIRQRLLKEAEDVFAADPERYSLLKEQNLWKNKKFAALVRKYPASTVITHLPNIFNLLPDVPNLLENNHCASHGRGTMAVLRQKGLFAAAEYYLGGRWYLLLIICPLLAVFLLTLLLALRQLLKNLRYWQWRWLLLFAVLCFYYIWAPGPVISGRYLLPALPMLIFMAAESTLFTRNEQQNRKDDI